MEPIVIRLPFPPTVNHYWKPAVFTRGRKRVRGMRITAEGKAYAEHVELLCRVARIAGMGLDVNLTVDMVLYPPDNRRRDTDNYRKAPWDALTKAGVWRDDYLVVFDTCIKAGPVKGGAAMIRIQVAEPIAIPEWAQLEGVDGKGRNMG